MRRQQAGFLAGGGQLLLQGGMGLGLQQAIEQAIAPGAAIGNAGEHPALHVGRALGVQLQHQLAAAGQQIGQQLQEGE